MAIENKQTLEEAINEALNADSGTEGEVAVDPAPELGFTPTPDFDPDAAPADRGAEKDVELESGETKKDVGVEAGAPPGEPKNDATELLTVPGAQKPAEQVATEPPPSDDPNRPLKNLTDKDLGTLPKGVKAETTQRFQELTRRLEERTAHIQAATQEAQMFASVLTSFETTPDNVSRLAKFSRALASNTPESLEYAYQEWQQIGMQLSKVMGRKLDLGEHVRVDPLDGHDDLKAKVADYSMTKEDAAKEAERRARMGLQQANIERQQSAAQVQQVVQQAMRGVQEVEHYWDQTLTTPGGGNLARTPLFSDPAGGAQPVSMHQLLVSYATQAGQAARSGRMHPQAAVDAVRQYAQQLGGVIIQSANAGTLKTPGQAARPHSSQQPLRAGGRGGKVPMPGQGDGGDGLYDAITSGLGMS